MGRPSKDATPCALLNKNVQLYKECDVCREAAEQPGGRRQWTINEWRLADEGDEGGVAIEIDRTIEAIEAMGERA